LALGADVGAPLALHAVEGEQVGGSRRAALQFVEVDHFQAVARARVVRLPLCRTHRGAQRQAADAAHAVDANFHVTLQLIKLFRKFETLARIRDTRVTDQFPPPARPQPFRLRPDNHPPRPGLHCSAYRQRLANPCATFSSPSYGPAHSHFAAPSPAWSRSPPSSARRWPVRTSASNIANLLPAPTPSSARSARAPTTTTAS